MTTASDWTRCRPFIEAALPCTGGTHDIEDIRTGVSTGHFQFWPGRCCAVITEINVYPRLRELNFFLGGGDLRELIAIGEQIEAWGKANGCTRSIGSGRTAWGRALRRRGYQPMMTMFAKDLG